MEYLNNNQRSTLYRKHYDALPGEKKLKAQKLEGLAAQYKKVPGFRWEEPGDVKHMAEEVYDQSLPTEAMSQVMNAAIDELGYSEQMKKAFRGAVAKNIADVITGDALRENGTAARRSLAEVLQCAEWAESIRERTNETHSVRDSGGDA